MGVLSAVESAWTARFINAAGPDLEPREDAFPCLRLIEHIATRTTDVREAAMLGFSQHYGCVNQDFNSRRAYRENNVHHRQPSISEIARSFPGSGLRLLTTSHCLS